MKRLIASVALLLALSCYMVSCEKDDICAEGTATTPSLVVEFYDKSDEATLTNVNGLKYFVEGMTDTISPGSVSSIRVPLRVDATSTKWGFVYYRPNTSLVTPNTDFLEFKYIPRTEYVSRACGYKTLFTLDLPAPGAPNPVLTNGTDAASLWIDHVDVITPNIENEDDVHIKIYF